MSPGDTLGTDAANVAQVDKIVDTAKTHYLCKIYRFE